MLVIQTTYLPSLVEVPADEATAISCVFAWNDGLSLTRRRRTPNQ